MKLPVKKKISKEEFELRKFSFEQNYKLVYITALLFFISLTLTVFFGFKTIIPLLSLLKVLIISILSCYLIQTYFFKTIFPMKKMEYLMVSALGFGPALTSLFLILNYFIPVELNTCIYELEKVKHRGYYQEFEAEGLPCEEYPELCIVYTNDIDLTGQNYIEVTLARGIGGFEIIKEVNLPK